MKRINIKIGFIFLIFIIFTTLSIDLKSFAYEKFSNNSIIISKASNSRITVKSTTPENYEYNVPLNVTIAVKFSEGIRAGDNFKKITLKDNYNNAVSINPVINNDTLFINHSARLDYSRYYTVTIPEGAVKGISTNNINEYCTFSFTTEYDTSPPYIVSYDPDYGDTDIAVDSVITIKYDEKIKSGVNFSSIELEDEYNDNIPADVFIKDDTITIKPRTRLKYSTYYHYTIPSGAVEDLAGNRTYYADTVYFKTENEKDGPAVDYTIPLNGAAYVPVDSKIAISFNKNIKISSTLNGNGIKLKSGGKDIPIDTYISGSMIYINLSKNLNLAYNSTYSVEIPANYIKDTMDNPLKTSYTFTFSTEPEAGTPKIIKTSPEYGLSDAAVDCLITATFNEKIQLGDKYKDIVLKDDKGNSVPYTLMIGEDVIALKPNASLDYDSTYYFEIPKDSVKNSLGNSLKVDYKYKFKTAKEKFPPYIKTTTPSNGAVDVATSSLIGVEFNEKIQKGDNFDYITLRDGKWNNIPITKEISGNLLKIKLEGSVTMAYGMSYTVSIPYGAVMDMSGNSFSTKSTFTFTTGYSKVLPTLISSTPASGDKDIPANSTVTLTFNDNINKGEFFDGILLKDSTGNVVSSKVDIDGNRILIKPESGLKYGVQYSIEMPYWSLTDTSGNAFSGIEPVKFTTETKDKAVSIKSTIPKANTKDFDWTNSIVLTFSRNITQGRDYKNIQLKDNKGNVISVSATINGSTLTVKPVSKLVPETTYSLFLPYSSVIDSTGRTMADDFKLTFTTKSDKDTVVEKAINFFPGYQYIIVTFSDTITSGKNYKSIILKNSKGKAVKTTMGIVKNMFVIKLNTAAKANEKYYLTIPSQALSDTKGNMLNKSYNLEIQANEKSLWKKQ